MPTDGFPRTAQEVVSTLTEIFKYQRRTEIVQLLEAGKALFEQINYDNWNGGTYTWALRLELPVFLFAQAEPQLKEVENEIHQKMSYLERLYPNDPVAEVTITPFAPTQAGQEEQLSPSNNEISRVWKEGKFRLFLSHLAFHKVEVSKLKQMLKDFGVDAFVAHEDIEPSQEWLNEIEVALRSMHALAALLTEKFHESLYTDQEIGWALGRGVPVIPVKIGILPYGLAGKYQGISGSLASAGSLSLSIVKTLLSNRGSRFQMRASLMEAFLHAKSSPQARRAREALKFITDFTDDEKILLWNACDENPEVKNSFGLGESLYEIVGLPPKREEPNEDVSF